MPYPGLPRETLTFLAGLENDNSRDWFDANRPDYDRYWTAAGLDLIAALSAPCAALKPSLLAVPKLNASLRRIHRDVRFSKDKRPYDPRLHIILSTAPAFNKAPGVHLVISPNGLGFGAGFYGFEPASLDEFRHNVASPQGRAVFETLLAKAAAVGAVLQDPDLTRVPKGFDPAPWDHYLRRKSVIVRTRTDQPHPDWLFTPAATDRLMTIVAALNPLCQWLTRFL